MKEITWYDVFLENINEIYPKKIQLVDELISLLCIEREAVYRRLRKQVFFPAHEVVKIASAWNISLDEITGINSGFVPFQLQPINYTNPSKIEIMNLQKRVRAIEHLKNSTHSEYMEVGNKLPRPLSTEFPILYKLKIFNWAYLYNNEVPSKRFSEVNIPKTVTLEFELYNKIVKNVTDTHFILEQNVFDYLVHNVLYFNSILLITEDEKALIKKELHALLDYMTEIADKGYYPATQKKVSIYISQLHNNTNYSYFYTEKFKSCRVHAFAKFDLCSYDLDMVTNFRNWMNFKKRASIQISEVNERSRIEYFAKQRKIVDNL
jgi:hypothetical protein